MATTAYIAKINTTTPSQIFTLYSSIDASSTDILHSSKLIHSTSLKSFSTSPTWTPSKEIRSLTPKTTQNYVHSSFASSSLVKTGSHISSSICASQILPTNITPTTQPHVVHGGRKLLLYIGIPVVVIVILLLAVISVKAWKSYTRKKRLQKEFTPCYTYDQSESEVVDGVIYPTGTNSVDLLHVDASPLVKRERPARGAGKSDDMSCLLKDTEELDEFASDTKRCESIAV